MIVLAVITCDAGDDGPPRVAAGDQDRAVVVLAAGRRHVWHDDGLRGVPGIGQVYLERILGLGYLETQAKIQVHFLMIVATGTLFTAGVALFLWDFFVLAVARQRTHTEPATDAARMTAMSEHTGMDVESRTLSAEHRDGAAARPGAGARRSISRPPTKSPSSRRATRGGCR